MTLEIKILDKLTRWYEGSWPDISLVYSILKPKFPFIFYFNVNISYNNTLYFTVFFSEINIITTY